MPPLSQEDFLQEFNPPTTTKSMSLQRMIGLAFSIIGSLFLSSYVSFLLLNAYPIIPDINFIQLWKFTFISPTFGIHLFAIFGFIFLLISNFFLLKSDRIILRKLLSIAIDGLVLLVSIYIAQSIFITEPHNGPNVLIDYFVESRVLTNRINTWGLFLPIYYLYGEVNGGTLGKKISGLVSQTQNEKKLSLKQAIQKTLIYAIPIWLILIVLLLNPNLFINTNESIFFVVCQWISFILYFVSLFMIFVSNKNNSLAEIFSNTTVKIKKPERL